MKNIIFQASIVPLSLMHISGGGGGGNDISKIFQQELVEILE